MSASQAFRSAAEIDVIARVRRERGRLEHRRLTCLAGTAGGGPRRFERALAAAVREGRARDLPPRD